MKKTISVVAIIIVLCLLCSCNTTQTYIKQDNIHLNYNNISAGSGCWIDNNHVCSVEHNFVIDLYLMDDTKKDWIDSLSYPYGAHLYNDKLYYFHEVGVIPTKYKFIEYDLNTKKKKTLASITEERLYNYFVAGEYLYVEVGENDNLIRDIVSVSLETNQRITVAKNIFSSGIVNGELNYISQNGSKYSVYKYDADNEKSILIGEFELSHQIVDDVLRCVNFHPDYIAFVYSDDYTAGSKIYIYRYDDNMLVSCDFEGKIAEFISYDRFAFFSVGGRIYRFNFHDNSIEKIAESSAYDLYLFVGSDDEVYVTSMEFDGIRRYSVDGKYEDVIID